MSWKDCYHCKHASRIIRNYDYYDFYCDRFKKCMQRAWSDDGECCYQEKSNE